MKKICLHFFLHVIVERKDNIGRVGGIYMPWSDSREELFKTEFQLKYPIMSFKEDTVFDSKNIGLYYQQVHLFFIPIWNYNRQIVTVWDENHYIKLSEQELNEIKSKYDLSNVVIPFWDRTGGKIVCILIILTIIIIFVLDSYKFKKT